MPNKSDTPASPAEDAGPTMTAEQIREALDRDCSVYVTRGAERFYIGEDDDCNGYHAWAMPGEATDAAVASFGECDYEGDCLAGLPDYRALSKRIAAWLNRRATPSTSPATGAPPRYRAVQAESGRWWLWRATPSGEAWLWETLHVLDEVLPLPPVVPPAPAASPPVGGSGREATCGRCKQPKAEHLEARGKLLCPGWINAEYVTPVEADAPAEATEDDRAIITARYRYALTQFTRDHLRRDVEAYVEGLPSAYAIADATYSLRAENTRLSDRVSQLEATVAAIRAIARRADFSGLAHGPLDEIRAALHATPERPEADASDPSRSIPQAVDVEALTTQLAAEHTARLAAEQETERLRADLEDAAGYLRLTTGTDAKMWTREAVPTIRALADRLAAFAARRPTPSEPAT